LQVAREGEIERLTAVNLSRVILVHVTIIFGIAAAALTGMNKAFFGVFIALKTLSDLSAILPQWNPSVAPKWLCWIMDMLPNTAPDKTFAEYFADDLKEEAARRAKNEMPA